MDIADKDRQRGKAENEYWSGNRTFEKKDAPSKNQLQVVHWAERHYQLNDKTWRQVGIKINTASMFPFLHQTISVQAQRQAVPGRHRLEGRRNCRRWGRSTSKQRVASKQVDFCMHLVSEDTIVS